ncbi:MAG: PIG-L deacetylase family protein, partial [Microthrixaceae bacterium]
MDDLRRAIEPDVEQITVNLTTPQSALVIVAHPDDAEFQCGATLAKWARAGCVVHHLILTDGSKGTWDRSIDQSELVQLRKAEQRQAATILGGTGVIFLSQIDGELESNRAVRAQVSAVIRRVQPEVVLGHDPWKRYRLHPDHAAAGRLCVEGIVAARDPFFHPEQLIDGITPHRPQALLLFEPDQPNHAESVTDQDLEAQIKALLAHQTQTETTHFYKSLEGDPVEHFRIQQRELLQRSGRWASVPLAQQFH